ncbi:LctP family lactate transporter [Staphylococcus aureus M1157]|uniref:L-lactate permease n=1 Tax=Staphylococcus aureus TaxID=1280 RepID=UPI00044819F6|nr:L-lactate permease [Staphylococcus aureus]EWN22125.1 LctP family lactate transporter [Staphylococcus aureus M1157]
MLVNTFNPFDNLLLSSLIAAIPIVLFLLCLTVFKMKGIYAAITTLVVTLLIAIPFFKLPVGIASGAVVEGFFQGIIPIGYIVMMAVLLYKITVESGQFLTIQDSITNISQDQRIQVLLIGFAFNAFLEGAAGFGVPIAICALLLTQLGFNPLKAAMLCLVANAASGAFGAIGIPVGVVETLKLPGDVSVLGVSQSATLTLAIINFIIPPLLTMLALAVFSKKFQPKHIYRVNKDEEIEPAKAHSAKAVLHAWSPFIVLTVIVMIWSAPFFKNLFLPNGALSSLVFKFNLPGTISEVTHKPLVLTLNIIGQTGTAILLTIIITILMSKKVNFKDAVRLFGVTFKELWLPVLTICFILAISKITTYGGLSAAMGQGIAKAGNVFPVLSPILGWIGVFMTGSVVNNNSLFAPIQASVAQQIGTSGSLLVSANTVGGVAAKLISPQSIAIATAAVKQVGKESELLKMTLKYSVCLLIFICIWTFILSLL